MSNNFKVRGQLVDRPKVNVQVVSKMKRQKLHEQKKQMAQSEHIRLLPDEFDDIKNFASKEKTITKKKPEFYFDFHNDNKPLKIKKQSRFDKMRQPFTNREGKKIYKEYHKL